MSLEVITKRIREQMLIDFVGIYASSSEREFEKVLGSGAMGNAAKELKGY